MIFLLASTCSTQGKSAELFDKRLSFICTFKYINPKFRNSSFLGQFRRPFFFFKFTGFELYVKNNGFLSNSPNIFTRSFIHRLFEKSRASFDVSFKAFVEINISVYFRFHVFSRINRKIGKFSNESFALSLSVISFRNIPCVISDTNTNIIYSTPTFKIIRHY